MDKTLFKGTTLNLKRDEGPPQKRRFPGDEPRQLMSNDFPPNFNMMDRPPNPQFFNRPPHGPPVFFDGPQQMRDGPPFFNSGPPPPSSFGRAGGDGPPPGFFQNGPPPYGMEGSQQGPPPFFEGPMPENFPGGTVNRMPGPMGGQASSSYPGLPSLFEASHRMPGNPSGGNMMNPPSMGHLPPTNLPPAGVITSLSSSVTATGGGPPAPLYTGSQLNKAVSSATSQPPTPTSTGLGATEDAGVERKMKKCDLTVDRPFDAVIVVTQKELKHYAEMVERRLLELNMVVDMIFLLNEKALNKAIDDMACRGVLYILVVQFQHEEHKSITANIMHGTPQEHRNMPLEDALVMLARNFNAYLSSLRVGGEQPTMGFLLSLLAEGKHLSVAELDRIITHLGDRRDRMIEQEGGRRETPVSKAANTAALQQKILSIVSNALMNPQQTTATNTKPSSDTYLSGAQAQNPLHQPPATALANMAHQFGINFNSKQPEATLAPPQQHHQLNLADPSLKKTLDSLLQNPNLFKNINSAGFMSQTKPATGGSGFGGGQ